MPNVLHMEICADDLESAISFYSQVFGWQFEKVNGSDDSWDITTGSEDEDYTISCSLTQRWDETDSTVPTINVPSLDDAAKKITEAGGRVLAPKTAIPGWGYVQYCHDLEGNRFGVSEWDESAK